jgi:hypothetical protein
MRNFLRSRATALWSSVKRYCILCLRSMVSSIMLDGNRSPASVFFAVVISTLNIRQHLPPKHCYSLKNYMVSQARRLQSEKSHVQISGYLEIVLSIPCIASCQIFCLYFPLGLHNSRLPELVKIFRRLLCLTVLEPLVSVIIPLVFIYRLKWHWLWMKRFHIFRTLCIIYYKR